jgi:hypothetical protein
MHYKKQILESENKVNTLWKIVKDKLCKHSTVEENPLPIFLQTVLNLQQTRSIFIT